MSLQSRLANVGVAIQSAKGSPATSATYRFGVSGGQVVNAEIEEEDRSPTGTERLAETRERLSVVPGAAFDVDAIPKSLGVLLRGALGSVASTDNADGTYTHVFEPANDIPYLTLFGMHNLEYYEADDARVDTLEFSWDGTEAASIAASFQALDLVPLASEWTYDEHEGGRNALRPVGGTFTIDGATAAVKGGSFSIENGIEALILSKAITPGDVIPGMLTVSLSLNIVPDDLALFRTVLTGSSSGTVISTEPYFGSLGFQLKNANGDVLDVQASDAVFSTEFPDADPEGGPVELEVEAIIVRDETGTSGFTASLTNEVASY